MVWDSDLDKIFQDIRDDPEPVIHELLLSYGRLCTQSREFLYDIGLYLKERGNITMDHALKLHAMRREVL